MLASKIISQLLLPPGGLIVLSVIGLICWGRVWGRVLIALSMLCLWLLSTEPVQNALISPLENRYESFDANQLDVGGSDRDHIAIVLLGGGVYEQAPEYQGHDALVAGALIRTVYAADLAQRTGLNVFAAGGAGRLDKTVPEGEVMRRWLVRLGVPESNAHSETASRNTWENAENLKSRLASAGVKKIVLVTTAWHMPRSVWVFESNGFQVIPAPCAYVAKRGPYDVYSYLPHWNTLSNSANALHEYLGLLWYRLRYRTES